jgi:hypothetical protein
MAKMMCMEQLAIGLRAVEIVGAVIFAFLLLGVGFYCVFREYRLVSTFPKLKQFIELTNDSSFKAEVTKGSFSYSRSRPGLIMMVLGTVLLATCILRPLKLDTEKQPSSAGFPEHGRKADSTYERWLKNLSLLKTKSWTELGISLGEMTGPDEIIGQKVILADKGQTAQDISLSFYGDSKFTSLIRLFNPNLPESSQPFAQATPVQVWFVQPLEVTHQHISIASTNGTAADYIQLAAPILKQFTESPDFKANPKAFVNRSPLGVFGFIAALKSATGVSWSYQPYVTEQGDTGDLLARIVYGEKEYLPFLLVANVGDKAAFEILNSRTNQLPAGTELHVFRPIVPQ